ncbi:MAG: hypothetical protein LUC44_01180 [Prevotellaceae bacterium]|nr:hypothetical protein [Prevotellaceae bacterium]
MNETLFTQMAAQTKSLITQGRLYDALAMLTTLTNAVGDNQLSETREKINADYDRLLNFMRQAGEDSSRSHQHMRLIQQTIGVLQNAKRLFRLRTERDIYCKTWQKYQAHWDDGVADAINALHKEEQFNLVDATFNLIWTSPQLTTDSKTILADLLAESEEDGDAAYFLSAITLSLLEYFDNEKLNLLLKYCGSDDINLRSRALLGACVSCQLYSYYIQFYPETAEKFRSLDLIDEMAIVQHDFCIHNASHKISEKLNREIFPNIKKASNEFRKKLGFDPADSQPDEDEMLEATNKMNEKTLSDLRNSCKAIYDMINDGVDLNIEVFGPMKNYPFFKEPCHWFLPFKSSKHKLIAALADRMKMCDSDKHSFYFYLFAEYKDQSDEAALQQHIIKQLQENGDELPTETHKSTEDVYHNVILCLSRLLRNSPWKSGWPSIFSGQMLFLSNPILKECVQKSGKYLREVGKTCLRYDNPKEAKNHLLQLLKLEGGSARLFASLAKCEKKTGNLRQAANYLRQATLLEPDNKTYWERLHKCFAQLGDYEAQLDCLQELENLLPDDENTLVETGLCLMQLKRWKEAQNKFFRLELTNRRVVPSMRSVAWCALQMKDLPLAHRYYHHLLEEKPEKANWEDCLNCAHTEWLEGNTREALELYRKYVFAYVASHRNVKDPLAPFDQDAATLLRLGVSQSDIFLIHDIIASYL